MKKSEKIREKIAELQEDLAFYEQQEQQDALFSEKVSKAITPEDRELLKLENFEVEVRPVIGYDPTAWKGELTWAKGKSGYLIILHRMLRDPLKVGTGWLRSESFAFTLFGADEEPKLDFSRIWDYGNLWEKTPPYSTKIRNLQERKRQALQKMMSDADARNREKRIKEVAQNYRNWDLIEVLRREGYNPEVHEGTENSVTLVAGKKVRTSYVISHQPDFWVSASVNGNQVIYTRNMVKLREELLDLVRAEAPLTGKMIV